MITPSAESYANGANVREDGRIDGLVRAQVRSSRSKIQVSFEVDVRGPCWPTAPPKSTSALAPSSKTMLAAANRGGQAVVASVIVVVAGCTVVVAGGVVVVVVEAGSIGAAQAVSTSISPHRTVRRELMELALCELDGGEDRFGHLGPVLIEAGLVSTHVESYRTTGHVDEEQSVPGELEASRTGGWRQEESR
jgi:hypothetical protein